MKKSQGMIEFMSLFIAVFLFFVIFLIAIQNQSNAKNFEKENILANNVALTVKNEIALASGAPDGYYREFFIPNNLLGKDYELSIEEEIVSVISNRISVTYRVLPANGEIQKGENIIRKNGGIVYLNS